MINPYSPSSANLETALTLGMSIPYVEPYIDCIPYHNMFEAWLVDEDQYIHKFTSSLQYQKHIYLHKTIVK